MANDALEWCGQLNPRVNVKSSKNRVKPDGVLEPVSPMSDWGAISKADNLKQTFAGV